MAIMHRISRYIVLSFIPAVLVALAAGPSVASPRIHEPAPDFELADAQGTMHRLSEFRGNVVVMNFWATWCGECVGEMPSLDGLYEQMKSDGLVVLGISINRNWDDISGMKQHVSYPLLLDNKGDVFVKKYTMTRLPVTIIIDRNGVIVDWIFGSRDYRSSDFIKSMNLLVHGKTTHD
jgi:peroxiredoxin